MLAWTWVDPKPLVSHHIIAHPDPAAREPATLTMNDPTRSAVLLVLCDRSLLRHVATFMVGVPLFVGIYCRETHAANPVNAANRKGLLPRQAIVDNNLTMLQTLYALKQTPWKLAVPFRPLLFVQFSFQDALRCALRWQRISILRWLLQSTDRLEKDPDGPHVLSIAVRSCHDSVTLEWLYTMLPPSYYEAVTPADLVFAAGEGNLAGIKFLHNAAFSGFSPAVMDAAAAHGQLDIVRFLHNHRREGCSTRAMDGAAENDQLDVLQFLHQNRSEGATKRAMDNAAANGHLEIVRFLHEHREEGCTPEAMHRAAVRGHSRVVEFLGLYRREGAYRHTLREAAEQGHLECVKALYELSNLGCLVEARAFAEFSKHEEIVAFLASKISRTVKSCCAMQHLDVGARRCQSKRERLLRFIQRHLHHSPQPLTFQ